MRIVTCDICNATLAEESPTYFCHEGVEMDLCPICDNEVGQIKEDTKREYENMYTMRVNKFIQRKTKKGRLRR
jgi:hypothetical protein